MNIRFAFFNFVALASAVGISSCASPMLVTTAAVAHVLHIVDDPNDSASTAPPAAPANYRHALELLENHKYSEALEALDEYLRQNPTAQYTQAAMLNSGRALEGLGRWSEAAERYRRVITACEGRAPRLQAMALYRLSFCHEALGDDQQTVAVLTDLLSRKGALPVEIARAELPARLAAAYARAGNFEKALQHYRTAENGIAQLRRGNEIAVPGWLPRTLYFMGSMSLRRVSWNDFEAALRPLARSQGYLLQSAELGQAPWSDRAANDLKETYLDLWRSIETPPIAPVTGDPVVARRALQDQQWERSALVLENLQELRARFGLGAAPSPAAQELRDFVAAMDQKIHKLLAQRPAGEGLTLEARSRKTGIRGRTVSPDATLERQFLKSAKESAKDLQDPNL